MAFDKQLNFIISAVDKATGPIKSISDSMKNEFGKISGTTLNALNKKLEELKNELNSVDVGSKRFKELQNEIRKTEKEIGLATSGMSKFQGRLKNMQPTFEKMTALGGVAFASLTYGIKGALDEAGKLESSLKGLESIANGVGENFGEAEGFIKSFTSDGLVPVSDAATGLKNLLASGLSLDKASEMMLRFKDSAAFGRQGSLSMGDAVRSATEGIKNQNSVLIDNAGVTKNLSIMWEEYAASIGKRASDLTDLEKAEAGYLGVIKETAFQMGDATKYADTYQGSLSQLNAKKIELQQTIGTALMPVMAELLKTITPIIAKVADWVKKNPELTKNLILGATAVAGLVTVLGTLGLAISAVSAGFGALTFSVTVFGTTTKIALGPIALLTAAIVGLGTIIYKNRQVFIEQFKAWGEIFKNYFNAIWTTIETWIMKIEIGFSSLGGKAKTRAGNMIDMFVQGIIGKWNSFRDAVMGVSETLANFLGFHSPTKEGPASDSDKWMPNLISMMSDGLDKGALVIAVRATQIANKIKEGIVPSREAIKTALSTLQGDAKTAFDAIGNNIQNQAGKVQTLKDQILDIKNSLLDLTNQIQANQATGQGDIASRAATIMKELSGMSGQELDQAGLDKKKKLEEELALAKSLVSDEQIQQAEALLNRNETQVILDRMLAREEELKDKKRILIEEYNAKKDQLANEQKIYADLVDQKTQLDTTYFNLFQTRIEKQQRSILDTIALIQSMNSMSGGGGSPAVNFGSSTQQATTTGSAPVTVNLGGVTVNNEADENRIVDKIKQMLVRENQLYNYGV